VEPLAQSRNLPAFFSKGRETYRIPLSCQSLPESFSSELSAEFLPLFAAFDPQGQLWKSLLGDKKPQRRIITATLGN